MTRPKYQTVTICLLRRAQLDHLLALLTHVPLDEENPLQVVISEKVKARTPDQNAMYHAGIIRPMADQAWIEGKKYSEAVWHEHFKAEYLPDENILSMEELAKRVKNPVAYRKWAADLNGKPICVGSTTDLTKFGMGEYCDYCTAFGASLGVRFQAVGE